MPRGHTGPPTWVVVHPWDMPAAELVAALEEFAAGLPPASTYFWIGAAGALRCTGRVYGVLKGGQAVLLGVERRSGGGLRGPRESRPVGYQRGAMELEPAAAEIACPRASHLAP